MRFLLWATLFLFVITPCFSQTVFINEIHYDNTGGDVSEGVEIAGPAGTDLDGWKLRFYNGADGAVYKTRTISGVILTDESGGLGFHTESVTSIQNGPDGIALINKSGSVIQFISYEGVFTATDGEASGMTSVNIGVSETGSTPTTHSLQLCGAGFEYTHFSWNSPVLSSFSSAPTSLGVSALAVGGAGSSSLRYRRV